MFKEDVLDCLYQQYRKDPWLQALYSAAGISIDDMAVRIKTLQDQLFVDTMTWQLAIEERMAGIRPSAGATIADRKSTVVAKWKSGGKVGASELQMIADSWNNGRVEVDFIDNKIQVTFTGEYGLPEDRISLELAMEKVKPAHLPIYYLLRYILVKDVNAMSVMEIETHKVKEFAFEGRP